MKTLDIRAFYLIGAIVFTIQAVCNVGLFFWNEQNVWSGVSLWTGFAFNLCMVWLFLSLRNPKVEVGAVELPDEDIKRLVADLKREAHGKKQ